MGSRVRDAETVYAASEAWVDRGLRTDDSLFEPPRVLRRLRPLRGWSMSEQRRPGNYPDELRERAVADGL